MASTEDQITTKELVGSFPFLEDISPQIIESLVSSFNGDDEKLNQFHSAAGNQENIDKLRGIVDRLGKGDSDDEALGDLEKYLLAVGTGGISLE